MSDEASMARGVILFCALFLLAASAAKSVDTYSPGSSTVILISPDTIVAAGDSRAATYGVLPDGTAVRDNADLCNLRRLDVGILATAAGLSRVGDFDALDQIDALYIPGDSVRTVAARAQAAIPAKLLSAILEFRRSAHSPMNGMLPANQATLEVAIMGTEGGVPATDVLTFRFAGTEANPGIASSESTCPGDCAAGRAAVYLGVHDSIDRIVSANPDLVAQPTSENVRMLVGLEYLNHPDSVGGPLSVVKIDRSGVTFVQAGACTVSDVMTTSKRAAPKALVSLARQTQDAELFGEELSARLESVPDLIVHEVATRHSRQGHRIQTDVVEAEVQVVGDRETYSAITRNAKPCASMSDLPGTWGDGGLATMLQVTRATVQSRALSSVSRTTSAGVPEIGASFEVPASDGAWYMMIGEKRYNLAFQGTVWIDQTTGKLTEIHWQSRGGLIEAVGKITGIDWDVKFSPVAVAGRQYDVPEAATYRMDFDTESDRSEWIDTRFSGFRRFGAASSISFE
jgi:hypothetical protein